MTNSVVTKVRDRIVYRGMVGSRRKAGRKTLLGFLLQLTWGAITLFGLYVYLQNGLVEELSGVAIFWLMTTIVILVDTPHSYVIAWILDNEKICHR